MWLVIPDFYAPGMSPLQMKKGDQNVYKSETQSDAQHDDQKGSSDGIQGTGVSGIILQDSGDHPEGKGNVP
jgi:hypothetical protein